MFHLVAGLLAFYVIRRLVWLAAIPKPAKWLVAALVLFSSQHHLITKTFFGTMASPEVPRGFLMVFNWGFGALGIAAFLLLCADVFALCKYLLAKNKKTQSALPRSGRLRPMLGVVALVLAGIGVWQSVRVPDVKTVEIAVRDLPSAFDGYRIVQLTDLHASRLLQRDWMDAVVKKANALEPALFVLTGDMVDGTVAARRDDVAPLRDLKAPNGVYAIPGNHEYYAEYDAWLDYFARTGLPVLRNEHVTISKDGADFILAGVTDTVASRYNQTLPDIEAALQGVPASAPIILLAHRPPGARIHARAGADLQLSGHTHGGHMWGWHWLVQYLNEGFVSGQYDVEGMQLYVSNGAGLWPGFAIRLGPSSEITQIVLRSVP